jgi:hypothetical protein
MSINDPVMVVYLKRRKTYILKQGRETFYDENDYMREWETAEGAIEWGKENLGADIIQEFGPLFDGYDKSP